MKVWFPVLATVLCDIEDDALRELRPGTDVADIRDFVTAKVVLPDMDDSEFTLPIGLEKPPTGVYSSLLDDAVDDVIQNLKDAFLPEVEEDCLLFE